ncbi:hypothetical protein [Paraflavitalea pollutisoli]|uniref:hypothetical protein n=1 Tax=Paraflavitalea pollutisoli TaxID=3034143 RepID=UPI0023EA80A1|nr:hypothetical protein [Paraflavitalea sp. H1-2-19X]
MATTTAKKNTSRAAATPKVKAASAPGKANPAKATVDPFLWASIGITGFSLVLKMLGKKDHAAFAGRLAAQTLLLGMYRKMKK